jgi:hypothetical protein
MKTHLITFGLMSALQLLAAEPADEAVRLRPSNVQIEVAFTELLQKFQTNADYHHVDEAFWLIRPFTATNEQEADQQFERQLRLLDVCLRARDKSFDLRTEDAGKTKVSPPFWSGEPVIAGMDPKRIQDPAARRKYEADITENRRVVERYRRESTFQRSADESETRVKVYLLNARSDPSRRSQAIATIKRLVKNEAMRDALVKFALSPPAAAQP